MSNTVRVVCPMKFNNSEISKINNGEVRECEKLNCAWWVIRNENGYEGCAIPLIAQEINTNVRIENIK